MSGTPSTLGQRQGDLSLRYCNRLAGHASPETTMQYIDKFWREKTDALEAWSEKLGPTCTHVRAWRNYAELSHSITRGLVGARGFEPRTSCAQGKRATRLRHAPNGKMPPFCQASSGVSSPNLEAGYDLRISLVPFQL